MKRPPRAPIPPELIRKAKTLWKSDQSSALELGTTLHDIKNLNPHGSLKKLIVSIAGKYSIKIQNRFSYCMGLVKHGKKQPKKDRKPNDPVLAKLIHEVGVGFKQLYDYAQAGDVDCAVMMAKTINQKTEELVETAKRKEPAAEWAKAAPASGAK